MKTGRVRLIILKLISHANHVKFRGVLLDETLTWRSHLIELPRKLARSVGIFYKLRHHLSLYTFISIYYSLFYPFLTYGIVVWRATYENLLKPILTARRKVIRAITFSEPTAHSSSLFSDLKILHPIKPEHFEICQTQGERNPPMPCNSAI